MVKGLSKPQLIAMVQDLQDQVQTLQNSIQQRDRQIAGLQARQEQQIPPVQGLHEPPTQIDMFRQMIAELRTDLQAQIQQQINPQPLNQPQHQPVQQQVNNNRQLLRPYSGKKSGVSPTGWINFFEFRVGNVTDQQKYITLCEYLSDEAQNWLVTQFQRFGENPNWELVKQAFINHFSGSVVPPAVAAVQFKFKTGDDIETYFEKKCHLLELANLRVDDQIGFLTDGVEEDQIRDGLIIATINTLQEWVIKAKSLLINFERKRQNNKVLKSQLFKQNSSNAGAQNNAKNFQKGPPPSNCKNCWREEKVERKHWHTDCPYYKPNFKPSAPNNSKTDKPTAKIVQSAQVDEQDAQPASPSSNSSYSEANLN